MTKPIQIVPVGDKFQVKAYGHEVIRNQEGRLDVPREIRGVMTYPVGLVAFFTYKEAVAVAHQIGHYYFNLGDFLFTYCDGLQGKGDWVD